MASDPAGAFVAVAHQLARNWLPASQLEHGWMNAAALTLLDSNGCRVVSYELDDTDKGAANPWALGWTGDGKFLCVTHAGTHELSVIKAQALMLSNSKSIDPSTIPFIDASIRTRVALPLKGLRTMAIVGSTAYICGYFFDTLVAVDIPSGLLQNTWQIGPGVQSQLELDEQMFHDAALSRGGWQSCGSCHPEGRADGLNWDLLNDGIGNPKNTKSLVLAYQTPPSMSMGKRENAFQATRAGLRKILFAPLLESEAKALDAYIMSLTPEVNRSAHSQQLAPAIRRGRALFKKSGCVECHPRPLYTDLRSHDVGSSSIQAGDAPGTTFDTPTLVELWRTAPYLHDGSAPIAQDVFKKNKDDKHGHTSSLSPQQLNDLCSFLLTL